MTVQSGRRAQDRLVATATTPEPRSFGGPALIVLASIASIWFLSWARAFLIPLLIMAIAFSLLFVTLHVAAMRNEILRRRVRSLQMLQASRQAA